MNTSKLTPTQQTNKPVVAPWVWLAVSIVYLFSPVDLIPDIPIVGHVDDILFNIITTLNLMQAYVAHSSKSLASLIRLVKIGVIVLGALLVLVVTLFGYAIVQVFQN